MKSIHSFHIPVMGTGFSIDTPIKVAPYGISSVISLVDDELIEEMRKYYLGLQNAKYSAITKNDEDFRARRITAYLDLVDQIVKEKFDLVKGSAFEPNTEITKYFELLPDDSPLKVLYQLMLQETNPQQKEKLQHYLRSQMRPGDINVNIMTKLDRTNYGPNGEELSIEFSDALAALRGYANSTLSSSIVFSAGINRRLYSYVEKFKDFYADATGFIKKKIILKVSDFRSSLIQGKFFAKKGLWVSEYRIESGLNCGGHVFPSDGFLMGPILEEFKKRKHELITNLHQIYNEALAAVNRKTFVMPHDVRITAQGGIGTATENKFLLDYFQVDSTGWATPFLLVPEATNVDDETLKKLSAATEEDLYVSDISPLGVSFNNLRTNNSDLEKERKIQLGRPGSACPKGYLVSNTEFTKEAICTASRQYQKLKLDQLQTLNLDERSYQERFQAIVQKACICNDLGEPPLINHKIMGKHGHPAKRFTAVCPGPNIAYFSKIATLREMVDHIYGRANLLNNTPRPHMFIKELKMYIEYLMKDVRKAKTPSEKEIDYFIEFKKNILEGIAYYRDLYPKMTDEKVEIRQKALEELDAFQKKLDDFIQQNLRAFTKSVTQLVSA